MRKPLVQKKSEARARLGNLEQLKALQMPAFLAAKGRSGKILERMLDAAAQAEDLPDALYSNPEQIAIELLEVELSLRQEQLEAAKQNRDEKQSLLCNLVRPKQGIGGYLSSFFWTPEPASPEDIAQAMSERAAALSDYNVCQASYESLLDIYNAREDNPKKQGRELNRNE